MTPLNSPSQLYRAQSATGNAMISDPGDTGSINVTKQLGVISMTTGASGETRTLAVPDRSGVLLLMQLGTDGGGDAVVTVTGTYDGSSSAITFGDVGDWVWFVSVKTAASTYRWRVLAGGGTGVPAYSAAAVSATEVVATNVNTTNANVTLCAATNVTATNVNATNNVKCAILNATTSSNTAECAATNVNATNATLTNTVKCAILNATANATISGSSVILNNTALNIQLNGTASVIQCVNTKIGVVNTDKLGLYGVTPVVQPAVINNAANNNADEMLAQLNKAIAAIRNLGICAQS